MKKKVEAKKLADKPDNWADKIRRLTKKLMELGPDDRENEKLKQALKQLDDFHPTRGK